MLICARDMHSVIAKRGARCAAYSYTSSQQSTNVAFARYMLHVLSFGKYYRVSVIRALRRSVIRYNDVKRYRPEIFAIDWIEETAGKIWCRRQSSLTSSILQSGESILHKYSPVKLPSCCALLCCDKKERWKGTEMESIRSRDRIIN